MRFIAVVQRGCDQLMDILLMNWWPRVIIINPHIQLVWGLQAGGQPTIINHQLLPPGGGFSIWRTTERYCYEYPLMRNQDLAPRLLLTDSPWSRIPSLPSLTTAWICLLEPREGHAGRMKVVSCNQRDGDTDSLCAWEPHRVLLSIISFILFPQFPKGDYILRGQRHSFWRCRRWR